MHENPSEIRDLKTDISNAPLDQEITFRNFAKNVRLDSVHQLTRSISATEIAALGLNSTQNQKAVSRAFTSIGRVSEKIAEIKLAKQFGDPWSKSIKVHTFVELNEFAGQLISASSWEQHDAASLVIAQITNSYGTASDYKSDSQIEFEHVVLFRLSYEFSVGSH
jgi:hypothetical protein